MARLLFDRKVRLLCALLWGIAWVVVAALLLMPLNVQAPPGSDLVAHFVLFGSMAFAAVGFSHRPVQLAWLALTTITLGVGLEYAQAFVPTRYSEITDAIANGVGALFGYAIALLVLYFVIRPADPRLRAVAP